jgi:hypothetical protein
MKISNKAMEIPMEDQSEYRPPTQSQKLTNKNLIISSIL